MKKIYLIFLLLSIIAYSQSEKKYLEVDYKFSTRLSKQDTTKTYEIYKLFVTNTFSYYLSEKKIKNDSLKQVALQKKDAAFTFSNVSILNVYESIKYDRESNVLTTYKHIAGNPIAYSETSSSNWKPTNRVKKNSDGLLLHNAELDFGGRKWSAWYSTDYPFSEGPYKFRGLPGLIFEISDSENIFNIQLIKIKKISDIYNKDYSKFKLLPKDKYITALNSYIYNPLPELSKMLTPESQEKLRRKSIEKYKNTYYIEKDFE